MVNPGKSRFVYGLVLTPYPILCTMLMSGRWSIREPVNQENPEMMTAAMTTRDLVQLDIQIGHKLNEVNPSVEPEKARSLLRQRREVRNALEGRRVAASN